MKIRSSVCAVVLPKERSDDARAALDNEIAVALVTTGLASPDRLRAEAKMLGIPVFDSLRDATHHFVPALGT